ncbi:MAG TPA: RNA polymerase sigma factor [Candidatus Paceibacterota bacterium]|nr:RNA polymerase sigma factor [Candidatus Paceibacterota bacterium]
MMYNKMSIIMASSNSKDTSTKKIKSLVRKAQKGDAESFGIIYEIFAERIYRYIYLKTSSREEAEDLTQQVFVRAWEALPQFEFKKNPFSSWLYSIARNLITDFYRKKKPDFSLDSENAVEMPDDLDLTERLIIQDEIRQVFEAINQLPLEQKDLLLLRFVDDLSYDEIASIMNKSPLTLRVIQHRALKRLKELMGEGN